MARYRTTISVPLEVDVEYQMSGDNLAMWNITFKGAFGPQPLELLPSDTRNTVARTLGDEVRAFEFERRAAFNDVEAGPE